jgi:hypothetical protein
LCDSGRLRSIEHEKICEVALMRGASVADARQGFRRALKRVRKLILSSVPLTIFAMTSFTKTRTMCVLVTTPDTAINARAVRRAHAPGFAGPGSTGTSGAPERRDCLASCRAFLAASFCFFA